jgi:kinesin family protein 2/24
MPTCSAYGQRGSGNTYILEGDCQNRTQDCKKGIYAMAAEDVCECLQSPEYKFLNQMVSAGFFETCGGEVFDLVASKAELRILVDDKQHVQVMVLTERAIHFVDELLSHTAR